jgi:hypothetical protein
MDYTEKYLKYKKKYLELKEKLRGGGPNDAELRLTNCYKFETINGNLSGIVYLNDVRNKFSTNQNLGHYLLNSQHSESYLYKTATNDVELTSYLVSDECQYKYYIDDTCKKSMPGLAAIMNKPFTNEVFNKKCQAQIDKINNNHNVGPTRRNNIAQKKYNEQSNMNAQFARDFY